MILNKIWTNINIVWFYLKNKNTHKYCTIVFNILFNVHLSKLKKN